MIRLFHSKFRFRLFHNSYWVIIHFAHIGLKIQLRPLPDWRQITFIDHR